MASRARLYNAGYEHGKQMMADLKASGVCIHGGLRRQCETCDLADRLEVAEAEIVAEWLRREAAESPHERAGAKVIELITARVKQDAALRAVVQAMRQRMHPGNPSVSKATIEGWTDALEALLPPHPPYPKA